MGEPDFRTHPRSEDLGFKFPPQKKKESRFARNKWDLFYLILANNSTLFADAASNNPSPFANFCTVVLSHVIFAMFWVWINTYTYHF